MLYSDQTPFIIVTKPLIFSDTENRSDATKNLATCNSLKQTFFSTACQKFYQKIRNISFLVHYLALVSALTMPLLFSFDRSFIRWNHHFNLKNASCKYIPEIHRFKAKNVSRFIEPSFKN